MEKLENYRLLICQLLNSHATEDTNNLDVDVEYQVLFDKEHDHYQLLNIGWKGLKRVYECFIHLDIKDGKVWIQRNMTEIDLAQYLVSMGVPKEDIILGLHPSYKRPYTGYGVTTHS